MSDVKESPRPSYLLRIGIPHETKYSAGHTIVQSMLVGEFEKVALINDFESLVANGCSVSDQLLKIFANFERQKLRPRIFLQGKDAHAVRSLDIDFQVVGQAVLSE
jgi:translation initiation factor 1 (eIF-1/SUI1)